MTPLNKSLSRRTHTAEILIMNKSSKTFQFLKENNINVERILYVHSDRTIIVERGFLCQSGISPSDFTRGVADLQAELCRTLDVEVV